MDYRVISIGTLAANDLWDERTPVRTGHATTTLVVADGMNLVVDPSLPAAALLARLGERTPVRAADVTHVFLTSADPLHRRGLTAFPDASWLAAERELDAALEAAREQLDQAGQDAELAGAIGRELQVLERCRPAPDRLATGVDLFPLPGVTPGCCGLLLSLPQATVLICGDAVPTREHLQRGKVLPECHDLELARDSFAEAVQIADVLVPGRDNVCGNPMRQPYLMG